MTAEPKRPPPEAEFDGQVDLEVDPAYAAEINRQIEEAEEEYRRTGEAYTVEELEERMDRFMAELRQELSKKRRSKPTL